MESHTPGMSHSDYSAELFNLCMDADAHQDCKLILAFDTCAQLAAYQELAKDIPHARQLLSRAHGITIDCDIEEEV